MVIPKLQYMNIGFDEAQKWLSSNTGKYCWHLLKELILYSVPNGELLYHFLNRMPNLEQLMLFYSGYELQELVVPIANIAPSPQDRLGAVLQLKELVLLESEINDLGFERHPVLQRLERLSLKCCHKLTNLAPRSISLTYLTYLEVSSCKGLQNLMTSSTAKSLIQLRTMKVTRCDCVKEIVTNERNEQDKVIEIVFSNLINLVLVKLVVLTSFCSHKNCEFKFPSLELLTVSKCPMMKTFTKSHTEAPKLQNIKLAVEGEEGEKRQLEGDLNATIQKLYEDEKKFQREEEAKENDNDLSAAATRKFDRD
ncbi:hypothetical protein CR513_60999, partial [Mucuna pruriens]